MAKAKTSITTENRSGSAADAAAKEQRTEMPLSDLHPFEGHPFKVLDDELMEQTVESIKQIGVVSPLIVRPDPEGGFEILSGHRRLHAAQLAGLETVPVIVKEMDDDAAIIFIGAIGDMYMDEVTTDDLRLLLVPISKQSASLYSKMNMLIKCVFYSAEESKIISCNPAASLSAKGGTPKQEKKALTDEQVKILLDTIRGLPPYVFVMIGLYAGLRREEILALRWDCVFLDGATPYISVRRAWRSVNNRPVISTELKTPAAKRDIPIPGKLVECLKEAKEKSKSEYVISDRNGNALAESQFVRVWKYIAVRSTEERCYYTYVNGQKIKHVVKPKLGEHQSNNPKLVYTMDFQVTPHQLRHTYITNLIYASVDPKTVQYLAGHENSKVTMDIYAKVKYNKPAQLHGVINRAIDTSKKD